MRACVAVYECISAFLLIQIIISCKLKIFGRTLQYSWNFVFIYLNLTQFKFISKLLCNSTCTTNFNNVTLINYVFCLFIFILRTGNTIHCSTDSQYD